jgi:hypothetical protein
MRIEDFTSLLKKPSQIQENQIAELHHILQQYPYFQSASLLYAKALGQYNKIDYQKSLRKTALLALNRKILFKLIQQKSELTEPKIFVNDNLTIENAEESENEKQETESVVEIPLYSNSSNLSDNYLAEEIFKINRDFSEKVSSSPDEIINSEIDKIKSEETENKTESNLETVIKNKHPEWTQDPSKTEDIFTKEVMNAFVEKEILKVTDIYKTNPVKQDYSNERHDFTGWLKAVHSKDDNKNKKLNSLTNKKENERKQNIIDRFIKEEPRISKPGTEKNFFKATSFAKESLVEDETIVTETLARIYWAQGNHTKAIKAYETLSLKYPEKSSYFASLIKEIKTKTK